MTLPGEAAQILRRDDGADLLVMWRPDLMIAHRTILPRRAEAARAFLRLGRANKRTWIPATELTHDECAIREINHLVFFRQVTAGEPISLGRDMGDLPLAQIEVSLCCVGRDLLTHPAAMEYLTALSQKIGP